MPLVDSALAPSCGFDGFGPRIWTLRTPDDLSVVQGANYFDAVAFEDADQTPNSGGESLRPGDFIVVQSDIDGTTLVDIIAVRSIVAGVVTVTPAASELNVGA